MLFTSMAHMMPILVNKQDNGYHQLLLAAQTNDFNCKMISFSLFGFFFKCFRDSLSMDKRKHVHMTVNSFAFWNCGRISTHTFCRKSVTIVTE